MHAQQQKQRNKKQATLSLSSTGEQLRYSLVNPQLSHNYLEITEKYETAAVISDPCYTQDVMIMIK